MFPQVIGWTVYGKHPWAGLETKSKKEDIDTLQIALVLSPIHITRGSMMTHRNGETVPL